MSLAAALAVVASSAALRPRNRPVEATGSWASAPTATPLSASPAAPSAQRETRALWVSRWDFKSQPDVNAIVDHAAYAHLNTILFQVRGQADALYTPGLEPWSAVLTGTLGQDPGWDPLVELIARAHARGIQVHAWLNVYPVWMGDTPPSATASPTPMYQEFNARYGSSWLQWQGTTPPQLATGKYIAANPAHPAVVDHVVAVCKDLLSRYALDGLHLDYVRYSNPAVSEDPVSNQAYADALAQNPGLSRAQWQRDQVTALVRRVRDEALPLRPGARLTTTAWPVYKDRWGYAPDSDGYNAYYQDSQGWAHDGLVSAIMPMLYGPTLAAHPERYVLNENENTRKNGERVWVAWTNRPIRDDNGRIVEVLSVGTDITARKVAEDRLKRTLEELGAAKERAEVADRLKSAFLATMSHELRTPLNSIIGFTGIILQGYAGPLTDEQSKQLNMVRKSANHLLSLINDVLDISKIEAGQLQVSFEPFDLNAAIEHTLLSTRPAAERKGLSLSLSVEPDVNIIVSDRRRVEQILLNLLSNAIKFTEKGGVSVGCRRTDGFVTVSVTDTGIGIQEKDMGALFTAFQQIDTGTTRKYEGTGLGLHICKRLVRLLGGEIYVESTWGAGTTFSFSLPHEGGAA